MGVAVSSNCRGLGVLNPKTKTKVEKLIEICKDRDIPLLITCTLRDCEEQNKLYSQGRGGNPGKIVTNAKCGDSFHNYGLAVDFAKNSKTDAYSDDKFFQTVGEIAETECQLTWGGRWVKFPDKPHLEDSQFGSVSELKKKYGTPEVFIQSW